MTASNFDHCLEMLLEHEGLFTADPHDRGNRNGGSTMMGVTSAVWEKWTGKPADHDTMRALEPKDIGEMYRAWYWDAVKADDLKAGLDWAAFDWCVNSGAKRPSRAMQKACGASPDGVIGPKTLALLDREDAMLTINNVHKQREAFYKRLSDFDRFGRGWLRRNDETRDQALKMAAAAAN